MADEQLKFIIETTFKDRGIKLAKSDIDDLAKKIKGAASESKKAAPAFGKMGQILGGLGIAFGAAEATRAIIGFSQESIAAASDLNETYNKVGEVFGDATDQIVDFSQTSAEALGQSKTQAMNAASTFGVFGKSAGLAGDDLADFSTGLTGLASDLASFYNTSPEDAILAIGAALRGESEPIRRYGVLLDDATLRQKAFEIGITDTTKKALTPQQRVLAAYQVILDQTAVAQGDFARTSDGLANSQRIQAAEMENLKADIGQGLLPMQLELTRIEAKAIQTLNLLITKNQRLRDALIDHEKEVRETSGTYKEYTDELQRSAGVAGLVVDENGDLVKVTVKFGKEIKKVVQANFALSQSQYDVQRSGISANEAMRELQGQQKKVAEAADAAKTAEQRLKDELNDLKEIFGGAVSKEIDDFKGRQSELIAKADELKGKISELEKKKYLTNDQKQELSDLQSDLSDTNDALEENAAKHEETTARIIFGYYEQAAARDGLTQSEVDGLIAIGKELGIYDEATALTLENVGRSWQEFNDAGDIRKVTSDAAELTRTLDQIPTNVNINVHTRYTYSGNPPGGLAPEKTTREERTDNLPPEKRQHGGPVQAGRPYIVGEGGVREIFVPPTSGTIVPLGNAGGAGRGGIGGLNIEKLIVIGAPGNDEEDIADKVVAKIARASRDLANSGAIMAGG